MTNPAVVAQPVPVGGVVPLVVGQVVQALQQIQAQPLPPPAAMRRDLVATAELLGEDPARRRPPGAPGAAVVGAWAQAAAGTQGSEIVGGDGQLAAAGTAVPHPPSIRVTNGFGPVAGVNVAFVVVGGGGNVAVVATVTDANGIASAGAWTLGGAGLNTLDAQIGGVPVVTFRAVAV